MNTEKYTDSDKYQQEIAAQYEQRVSEFPKEEVAGALRALGFADIEPSSLQEATAGNMHATYVTPDVVVKINQQKGYPDYLSNKIVSDRLADQAPVVKVLAYDFFEKTDYEVLVMERAEGTMLLDDIFYLEEATQKTLFRQVLDVVRKLNEIKFDDFGEINAPEKSYPTHAEFLAHNFRESVATIRRDQLADESDIQKIEQYFLDKVNILDDEKPVFVHTDLHMGNMLHDGDRLTAVLDFDYSLKAPQFTTLTSLLGFIGKPSQYVEGTKDFARFRGKNFHHLLPVLREELPELFTDPDLLQKLNLAYLEASVMWVADNWSADWNKEMIRDLLKNELPQSEEDLQGTHYGKVLGN